jgi:polysaccharide export outer membrane protein
VSATRIAALVLGLASVQASAALGQPNATPDASAQATSSSPPPYRLAAGDVIQVRLFHNPELNELLPIRPDGRISLALVGEIEAAGKTPSELSTLLTERYAASLKQSATVVIVKEFASQRVYIGGQVARPGIIPMRGRLTALQGISEAGGSVNGARLDSVVILRDQGKPEPLFMTVDLKAPLNQKGSDFVLQAGDIVFLPKTRVMKVADFMQHNVRDLIPVPLSLGVTYILGNGWLR